MHDCARDIVTGQQAVALQEEVRTLRQDIHLIARERDDAQRELANLEAVLAAARANEARYREALNCEHNHRYDTDDTGLWEYVEHKGKTWNRCRSCGLLELWEGGTFFEAALSASPPAGLWLNDEQAETIREALEEALGCRYLNDCAMCGGRLASAHALLGGERG